MGTIDFTDFTKKNKKFYSPSTIGLKALINKAKFYLPVYQYATKNVLSP